MTIQTAVLIDTLKALGADVRWLRANLFDPGSRRRRPGPSGTPVFAVKGETLRTTGTISTASSSGVTAATPNMILDDGGDATLLIHLGQRAEQGPKQP